MGTPPISDELLIETYKVYQEEKGSRSAVAFRLGISESTAGRRVMIARQRGLHLSPGAREAVDVANLTAGEASHGWIKTNQDGEIIGHSTFWKKPQEEQEDFIERVRSAFDGITAAKPVTSPKHIMQDLLSVYALFDVHFGMMAWGKETGAEDYDTKLAADDMRMSMAKVRDLTQDSAEAVLLIGGDMFHADDNRNETPANKHKLDVDGRHFDVLKKGISLIAETVESLLAKHKQVTVRVLRGNHDEHSHMVLTFALAERYRKEKRISIEREPRDLFMRQWGDCLIAAHHGDKAKPERLTMALADVCPFWSDTRHRYCFTGHVHHDSAKEMGGLRWESLRAFCPPDAYAASMGYAPRRALQSLTFHKQDGLVLRAIDPVQRAKP